MTWQEVLQKADFPTTAIVLDFETYFDVDYELKKMSTVEYVMDERFEITGLGMQLLHNQGESLITFYMPKEVPHRIDFLHGFYGNNLETITVVGQNLKFDCLILREKFGITPKYTIDLMDLDRMWDTKARHSLEAMVKRWGGPKPKGDTKQFKGFRWVDMSPEIRQGLEEYCKDDIENESFLFQKLLPLVVNRPEIELPLANQTLQLFLKSQIGIDFELGENLKRKMELEILGALENLHLIGVNVTQNDISGNKSFAALLEEYLSDGESIPLKPGKNGLIPAFAKDDEGLKQLLNHPKKEVLLLVQARQAIKSWPLHIARVESLMNQAKARNDKIGAPLSFCSAHTWRWGGAEKINLQNLGGRGRAGQGTHPLIQSVREMLIAPPGFVFGINDFSQIQARILPWLAGQDDLVRGFANGDDIYSEFATDLFQLSVRKATDDDPEPIAKLLTIRRGFGKDAILGCGFGMGTNKFYDRCRANNDLRPMIDSGEYDWNFIDRLIKTYRRKYSKIPQFWRNVESAWRFVTRYPGQVSSVHRPNYEHEKALYFEYVDKATYIHLLSGRCLRYPGAKVKRDNGLGYRWNSNIWGGFLTENIVQAVEVDIFGEALLRLEEAGFNIVLHGHDEIVCLFKIFEAEQKLKEMAEIMTVIPSWAEGLPIAVEGELTKRYKK